MKNKGIGRTVLLAGLALVFFFGQGALACTGITLKSADDAVVRGRTMEWGAFDMHSRISVIPRGFSFTGRTPDGKPGFQWKGRYGVVGLDFLGRDQLCDGINEKGLSAGVFWLPGFSQFQEYQPSKADKTLASTDLLQFILTRFTNVDQVRDALAGVRVVSIFEPVLGGPPPIHFMVTDPGGKSIVIEYANGEPKVYDNPLGVITNAPSFDWHLTNLRNYVNLSPVAVSPKKIEGMNFAPLGAGSGMIGLPGDFTPPSRFVRAVAFTATARPIKDGPDALYEVFRILDNFNVPLGAAEGSDNKGLSTKGMKSATEWTCASDLKNRVFYYHTQINRRVRQVDLKRVDFSDGQIRHFPLDLEKTQDILDRTPEGDR